jgi:hypothetical protein
MEKIMRILLRNFLVIITLSLSSIFATESIVGDYRLNGTDVLYTWITRANESLDALAVLPVPSGQTDADGNPIMVYMTLEELGFTNVPFSYPLPPGTPVGQKRNGPLSLATLQGMGINLNLSLYEDGTGQIYEGSYYPGVNFDLETCESTPVGIAVTDYLEYSSDANANLTGFTGSMIGTPATGPYAGEAGMGSFGLSTTDIFDYFPANPQLVNNADFVDGYADTPADANFGFTGGFYKKGDVDDWLYLDPYVDDYLLQPAGDVYLEWHATDGAASQSGFGELDFDPTQTVSTGGNTVFYDGVALDGESVEYWNPEGLATCILGDEDCDGTPFDRILGVSGPPIVRFNPVCGPPAAAVESLTALMGGPTPSSALNYPLFGTVDALSAGAYGSIYGGCLASVVDGATDQCDAAGGPVAVTAGLCTGASQTPEFAGACAYYGPAGAVIATCMQLGFTEEICAEAAAPALTAVDYYCMDVTGYDCATAGIDPCAVLTNIDFATGLCGMLSESLTTSETCEDWAGDLSEDTLNENAASVLGMTCTDAAQGYVDGCIEEGTANEDQEFNVMDPSFGAWGGMFTLNAATAFATCGAIAQATGLPYWDGAPTQACLDADLSPYGSDYVYVDDSNWDLSAANPAAGGRLTFHYDASCLRVVEVHEVNIDFMDITGQCFDAGQGTGDVDNSCADPFYNPEIDANCLNVTDIVLMVQTILGGTLEFQETCRGDINDDGIINVVDVVQAVQLILFGLEIDATSSEVIKTENGVQYTADGTVGAFQFELTHGEDFSIELTNDALVAEYVTTDNKTTVVIIMPETVELFTVSGDYEISEVLAANSNGFIESNVVTPEDFILSNAYPNPFNPTTSLLLNLDQEGIVAVKVFNINGQLVDLLTNGNMEVGMHTITWDAQEFASGVYFIKAFIGSDVITQKVSLMK